MTFSSAWAVKVMFRCRYWLFGESKRWIYLFIYISAPPVDNKHVTQLRRISHITHQCVCNIMSSNFTDALTASKLSLWNVASRRMSPLLRIRSLFLFSNLKLAKSAMVLLDFASIAFLHLWMNKSWSRAARGLREQANERVPSSASSLCCD